MYNLKDKIAANPEMSLLRKGLRVTGLEDLLQDEGPFTVFAPTNLAFAQLDKGLLGNWQQQHYYAYLNKVLSHHIVRGKIYFDGLKDGTVLYTIDGQNLQVRTSDGKASVNNIPVMQRDIETNNGILHYVDHVIFNS